jgi:hypothetical protein
MESFCFSNVVLVWDNDGQEVRNDLVLKRTVSSLVRAGKKVSVLLPPLLPGREKTDLNDILQNRGLPGLEQVLCDCLQECKLEDS